jgi:hypothetical protein
MSRSNCVQRISCPVRDSGFFTWECVSKAPAIHAKKRLPRTIFEGHSETA